MATAATPGSSDKVLTDINEQIMLCAICLERFKSPKILPCYHTYCEVCLTEWVNENNGQLICPTCKELHPLPSGGVKAITNNRFMNDLLQLISDISPGTEQSRSVCEGSEECDSEAKHWCTDCGQFFCEECIRIHRGVRLLRDHKVMTVEEYNEKMSSQHFRMIQPRFCESHPSTQLEFYCDTCQLPTCMKCSIIHHVPPEHKTISIESALEKYMPTMKKYTRTVEQRVNDLKQTKDRVSSDGVDLEKMKRTAESQIKDFAKSVFDKLKQQEIKLQAEVSDIYAPKRKQIDSQIELLEHKLVSAESMQSYLNHLLTFGGPVDIMTAKKEMEQRLRQDHLQEVHYTDNDHGNDLVFTENPECLLLDLGHFGANTPQTERNKESIEHVQREQTQETKIPNSDEVTTDTGSPSPQTQSDSNLHAQPEPKRDKKDKREQRKQTLETEVPNSDEVITDTGSPSLQTQPDSQLHAQSEPKRDKKDKRERREQTRENEVPNSDEVTADTGSPSLQTQPDSQLHAEDLLEVVGTLKLDKLPLPTCSPIIRHANQNNKLICKLKDGETFRIKGNLENVLKENDNLLEIKNQGNQNVSMATKSNSESTMAGQDQEGNSENHGGENFLEKYSNEGEQSDDFEGCSGRQASSNLGEPGAHDTCRSQEGDPSNEMHDEVKPLTTNEKVRESNKAQGSSQKVQTENLYDESKSTHVNVYATTSTQHSGSPDNGEVHSCKEQATNTITESERKGSGSEKSSGRDKSTSMTSISKPSDQKNEAKKSNDGRQGKVEMSRKNTSQKPGDKKGQSGINYQGQRPKAPACPTETLQKPVKMKVSEEKVSCEPVIVESDPQISFYTFTMHKEKINMINRKYKVSVEWDPKINKNVSIIPQNDSSADDVENAVEEFGALISSIKGNLCYRIVDVRGQDVTSDKMKTIRKVVENYERANKVVGITKKNEKVIKLFGEHERDLDIAVRHLCRTLGISPPVKSGGMGTLEGAGLDVSHSQAKEATGETSGLAKNEERGSSEGSLSVQTKGQQSESGNETISDGAEITRGSQSRKTVEVKGKQGTGEHSPGAESEVSQTKTLSANTDTVSNGQTERKDIHKGGGDSKNSSVGQLTTPAQFKIAKEGKKNTEAQTYKTFCSYLGVDVPTSRHGRKGKRHGTHAVIQRSNSLSGDKREVLLEFELGIIQKTKVLICQGDIIKEKVDVIANATNDRLDHAGGVAGAIVKAGGYSIQKDSDDIIARRQGRSLELSEVVYTNAGTLPSKWILHTVGPKWTGRNEQTVRDALYLCCTNLLSFAEDFKARSIAIPAIGTGIYGVPKDVCAEVMCQAVFDYFGNRTGPGTLAEVVFIDIDVKTVESFVSVFSDTLDKYGIPYTRPSDFGADTLFVGKESSVDGNQYPKRATSGFGGSAGTGEFTGFPGQVKNVTKLWSGVVGGNTSTSKTTSKGAVPKSHSTSGSGTTDPTGKGNDPKDNDCAICLDKIKKSKELPCKHKFCKACIDKAEKTRGPSCPVCKQAFGCITGDMPKGTMNDRVDRFRHLSGYPQCGSIVIDYNFPSGIQGKEHPNPGQYYYGTSRTAYLPNNAEGREVLKLLKIAFNRRLTFTIGTSMTTGATDTVTWNEIHHKTTWYSGPYGYPDPGYLKRVKEELADKGVK